MESYEYIVRYYTIDDEGVYRRGSAITKSPITYIHRYEVDSDFLLIDVTPIHKVDRLVIGAKLADWSVPDA